jgi:FMN phosphatase YigB (HAD superfamily)
MQLLPFSTAAAGNATARRFLLFSPGAVLFDDSVWTRWLLQLLSRMGLHTHPQLYVELWRRDYFEDVCFARREHWEALHALLVASGLSSGQADEVCAAARPQWRKWQASLHAFPQVAGTLSSLSAAGVSLGVAACCPLSAEQIVAQLERMELAHWFDFVLSSHDMGTTGSLAALYGGALSQWQIASEAAQASLVTSRPSEASAARATGLRVIAAYATDDPSIAKIDRFDQLLACSPSSPVRALAS